MYATPLQKIRCPLKMVSTCSFMTATSSAHTTIPVCYTAPAILQFPEDTRVQEGEGVVFPVEVTGSQSCRGITMERR